MAEAPPPWQAGGDAILLHVRLTPGAAQDSIDGVALAADGKSHLAVRVRAVPERGKANAALVALLAGALRMPKSAIEITRGGQSRLKSVRLRTSQIDAEALMEELRRF